MTDTNFDYIVYTDGGSRGNPGPAAIGLLVQDSKGQIVKKYSEYIGEATNNEAEYKAVIKALEILRALGGERARLKIDSELVVRQLNGLYKVKKPHLQALYMEVRNQVVALDYVKFDHVVREKNQEADKLVNQALDKAEK